MEFKNPELEKYINDFYKNSPGELEEFRLYCEKEHIPVIRRDTESFLKNLLYIHNPKRLLEVGTGAGYSATVFAKTSPMCEIATIEMIDKRIEDAKSNLKRYNVEDRVRLIDGDASDILGKMVKHMSGWPTHKLFDFVFIDCAKSRYRDFFDRALKITKSGAIIICDNVLLDGRTVSDSFIEKRRDKTSTGKMREFVEYLSKKDEHTHTSLLEIGDGLTFSVKK